MLNQKYTSIVKQYNIINIGEIGKIIEELKDKIFNIYAKEIIILESSYGQYFKHKIENIENVKKDISNKQIEIEKDLLACTNSVEIIEILEKITMNLLKYIESKKKEKELAECRANLEKKEKVFDKISTEKKLLEGKINKDVENFFHEELINQIYSKIDPHPEFKRVEFRCTFEGGTGKLNVYVNDDKNNTHISPSLYYSTAQLNVLSLSIFLAKALNAKDDDSNNVDCIFIDDPIQSMDSINILATIDLFRSLVSNYNKQIILSTHDENFHRLLEKKIPINYFDSKFIELETFGTVKQVI